MFGNLKCIVLAQSRTHKIKIYNKCYTKTQCRVYLAKEQGIYVTSRTFRSQHLVTRMLLTSFFTFLLQDTFANGRKARLLVKYLLNEGCVIIPPLNNTSISGFSHVIADERPTAQMLPLGGSTSSALNYETNKRQMLRPKAVSR